MNVQECYALLGGDYDDAKSRLMNDRMIEKFMLKFPQDETMQALQASLQAEDYELAFRNAHTLKGVAANLGFSALRESASHLTEILRTDKSAPNNSIVQTVIRDYERVLEALRVYQNEQQ